MSKKIPLPPLRHSSRSALEMVEFLDGIQKGLALRYPTLEKRRRWTTYWSLKRVRNSGANPKAQARVWRTYGKRFQKAAVRYQSPWLQEICTHLAEHNNWLEMENHVNRGQISSKLWLLEELEKHRLHLGHVLLIGGWYGALANLFAESANITFEKIINVEIDPEAVAVSLRLNAGLVQKGKFGALLADAQTTPLAEIDSRLPDTIINTSCEHLPNFEQWYAQVPENTLLCLQSNDYFSQPDHCNCVNSLEEFVAQVPLKRQIFAGQRLSPHKKYNRFMVIGYK